MANPTQPAKLPVVPPNEPAAVLLVPLDKQDEYAAILRSMSQHEDTLINNRFTWFSTLQGLLFTALAFMWKENEFPSCCLVVAVCLLGLGIAYSTRKTINDAEAAHDKLRGWWRDHLVMYSGPGRTGTEIDKLSEDKANIKKPWNNVPTAFIWIWGTILTIFILLITVATINRLSSKKASLPTVVSIQATQATIAIQHSEQFTELLAPAAPTPIDTAYTQRTTARQKRSAVSAQPK